MTATTGRPPTAPGSRRDAGSGRTRAAGTPSPSRLGRRNSELRLLVLAVLVSVGAQAAVQLAVQNRLGASLGVYAIGLTALFGAAHLAIRRFAPAADPLLLPLVALLNGLGLAMINRLDFAADDKATQLSFSTPRHDAPIQVVWTLLGVVLFVGVLVVIRDHRVLSRYGYTAALGGLVLLLLPSVLPARFSVVNGARIWIRVAGFSIQPSEVSKLLLIVFFASYLVAKRDVLSVVTRSVGGLPLPRARDLGPVLLAWLISVAVLVREKDLGSSLLLFGIFVVMLYVATERLSWLLIGVGLFVAGTFVAYHAFGHVRDRFEIWLHPFTGNNPNDSSFQLVQGLFGFATGGVLGTGLGRGQPQNVPFARTDFIFASFGEELGLVGVMALLTIYLLIVARGLRIGLLVRDSFGKLLAGGLAVSLGLQVFVVIGGVMRVIPLTGLTLPFLSYGGSSLLSNYVLVALLLRVSDAARRPPPAVALPPPATRRLDDQPTALQRRTARL